MMKAVRSKHPNCVRLSHSSLMQNDTLMHRADLKVQFYIYIQYMYIIFEYFIKSEHY